MELVWTLAAVRDREAIYDYIETDNPAAALTLDELFYQKSAFLIEHPRLGKVGRVAGTREFWVHSNYVLIYDITGQKLRILRVLHEAMRWPLSE
ncbi:type II toxin-antitoxin system mRNA interferase toxin, RelE/StbE family [Lysobacteraceae bacterium NML08-0793]|nr:type II toxin-antitoxin system mRNA interferase toxin, RelE/StbE family [Xanthomonadaceae bacterium NML08-0793]